MRQNFLQSSGQSEKEINVILSTNLIKKHKKLLVNFFCFFLILFTTAFTLTYILLNFYTCFQLTIFSGRAENQFFD